MNCLPAIAGDRDHQCGTEGEHGAGAATLQGCGGLGPGAAADCHAGECRPARPGQWEPRPRQASQARSLKAARESSDVCMRRQQHCQLMMKFLVAGVLCLDMHSERDYDGVHGFADSATWSAHVLLLLEQGVHESSGGLVIHNQTSA